MERNPCLQPKWCTFNLAIRQTAKLKPLSRQYMPHIRYIHIPYRYIYTYVQCRLYAYHMAGNIGVELNLAVGENCVLPNIITAKVSGYTVCI